jgi:hypothetical protein
LRGGGGTVRKKNPFSPKIRLIGCAKSQPPKHQSMQVVLPKLHPNHSWGGCASRAPSNSFRDGTQLTSDKQLENNKAFYAGRHKNEMKLV